AYPDGENWITAYKTLVEALAQSNVAGQTEEIWIADGTYRTTTNTDRTNSFVISRGVKIYGGFTGNETVLSQRNADTNATILSGEISDPMMSEDNAYHVIRVGQIVDTVLMDGFRICCGYANLPGEETGGGIYIDATNTSIIQISDCVLTLNKAPDGSAIFNRSRLLIEDCLISNDPGAFIPGSLILNSGPSAELHITNSQVTQLCPGCPEAIRNTGGAIMKVSASVIIDRQ
ncbi:MAG: hypothetical protein M3R25_15045, partial [Bacteroidota bacterium]|nr:hypothetical protein [Bacteroidota bacterium]